MTYKSRSSKSTIGGAASDGLSELQGLRDECNEIVDNASDGLKETARIQTFESTVETLDCSDDEPDCPGVIKEIEITITEKYNSRKGKGVSRAVRCENACNLLDAAIGGVDQWLTDNDDHDEMDNVAIFRDALQEIRDNCEGAEFPGMYG